MRRDPIYVVFAVYQEHTHSPLLRGLRGGRFSGSWWDSLCRAETAAAPAAAGGRGHGTRDSNRGALGLASPTTSLKSDYFFFSPPSSAWRVLSKQLWKCQGRAGVQFALMFKGN